MVHTCSVHLCTNRANSTGRKIHFFSFPLKNPERTQQWIEAVGRKGFIPTRYSKICSDHFNQDDFQLSIGGSYILKLKENAVPSIFPDYSSIISNAKKQHIGLDQLGCSPLLLSTNNESEYIEANMDNSTTDVSFTTAVNDMQENSSIVSMQSDKPILITPSKVVTCARPLFKLTPSKRTNISPTKSQLKNKIKLLQQQVRRQNKSIKNMKDLLNVLKKKKLLENESEKLLMEKFEGSTLDIFQNVIKNKNRKATGHRFSKNIKEFALTLLYYSPKAYAYARSILILPSRKSIMNWTSSVNAEPGIFSEVMQALKTLNPEDKHCNLCLDAMSLRKQIIWSDKFNKFIGYCDFGGELELEGTDTPATEALFFMLVSLNGKWKLPIGYVLQNKTTATIQSQLVKLILSHSYQVGLTIWGVTCDGAHTNISMMKILGCTIGNNYDDIICWFSHPVTDAKIYFVPDACHNLKLARNTLGNCKVLNSDLGDIRWGHTSNLYNFQQKIQLKFANKLSDVHINWHNNKMKVCYAAQTLSSSTAEALRFLKQQKMPGFENVDGTEKYCRVIDQIFDFLNSKSIFSKNYKSPITKQNIDTLENKILPLVHYLYTLKFDNKYLH